MARRDRERQPGGSAAILAAARGEHQRQLGEGRATDHDARAHRYERQEPAAAARRDERRGQCRHRSRTRLAALPGCSVPRRQAGRVMAAAGAATGVNRIAATACVMLATLMQSLDTTIAN